MPEWTLWIQHVLNGIVAGSTYILLELGLTLGFGILWIISFVHGELAEQNTHLALEVASRRGFSQG